MGRHGYDVVAWREYPRLYAEEVAVVCQRISEGGKTVVEVHKGIRRIETEHNIWTRKRKMGEFHNETKKGPSRGSGL